MSDILKKLAGMHNAQRQIYFGNALLGSSFSSVLYPAVSLGAKGLQHYSDMARNVVILNRRQDRALVRSQVQMRRLGRDVEGVAYGALADLGGSLTKDISALSGWIERNQKSAESIAKITMAVGALTALRPAKWALSLLGLGGVVPSASTAAAAASVLALKGDTANHQRQRDNWYYRHFHGAAEQIGGWEHWIGSAFAPPGGAAVGAPRVPTSADRLRTMPEASRDLRSMGWSRAQTAGILANLSAESGFNAGAVGDNGTSFGLAQWHGARARLFSQWLRQMTHGRVTDPRQATVAQQMAFLNWELRSGDQQAAGRALMQQSDARGSAFVFAKDFERPRDGYATYAMRANNAEMFMPQRQPAGVALKGGADLHIHITGAPPGTTVAAQTDGNVFAGAPRVTMPLPAGGGPAW